MDKLRFEVDALRFQGDTFEAVAPLSDESNVSQWGVDCETCCPGSCTGCTECNKCNMIF